MRVFLPLFPLGIVAFPEEQVNLHIFEPRYRELIGECRDFGNTFGISPYLSGKLMDIGTEMSLEKIVKVYREGEMDIITQGQRRYKIIRFTKVVDQKLYSGAEVEFINDSTELASWTLKEEVVHLLDEFSGILQVEKNLHNGIQTFKAYMAGHYIGLNPSQEYQLLSIDQEEERLLFIKEHLRRTLPRISNLHEIKKRIMMNGHFRELQSPGF
jgi:Lon protease-like protein